MKEKVQCQGFAIVVEGIKRSRICSKMINPRHGKICSGCRHKKTKFENPLRYTYNQQKSNARNRKPEHFPNGIPFLLTFAEWCYFWQIENPEAWSIKKYDLWSGKKPRKNVLSVDRIDATKGYKTGNLRVVTVSVNSQLRWNPELQWEETVYVAHKTDFLTEAEQEAEFADVPF